MRKMHKLPSMVLLLLFLALLLPGILAAHPAQAAETYASLAEDTGDSWKNTRTTYEAVIRDELDLLSDEEESQLLEKMKSITDYGNVMFVTANASSSDTSSYARELYEAAYGSQSGTIFLIDMRNRNLWIFSHGSVYRVITSGYANTITDNVYRLATSGKYFDCAMEVFDEELTLLEGGRIAQPMRYITAALMALAVAFLVNFIILIFQRRKFRYSINDETQDYKNLPPITIVRGKKLRQHTYSNSSGGGGIGGGGGGGGGGGHGF